MDASGVALVLIGPGSVEQVYTPHAPKKKKAKRGQQIKEKYIFSGHELHRRLSKIYIHYMKKKKNSTSISLISSYAKTLFCLGRAKVHMHVLDLIILNLFRLFL